MFCTSSLETDINGIFGYCTLPFDSNCEHQITLSCLCCSYRVSSIEPNNQSINQTKIQNNTTTAQWPTKSKWPGSILSGKLETIRNEIPVMASECKISRIVVLNCYLIIIPPLCSSTHDTHSASMFLVKWKSPTNQHLSKHKQLEERHTLHFRSEYFSPWPVHTTRQTPFTRLSSSHEHIDTHKSPMNRGGGGWGVEGWNTRTASLLTHVRHEIIFIETGMIC